MKIFYVTLNTNAEAEKISLEILSNKYAVCTNWFPIQCAYLSQDEIKQGAEVVLIIKTQDNQRKNIEKVINQHITYTNFIAEINIDSVNSGFAAWLKTTVPL